MFVFAGVLRSVRSPFVDVNLQNWRQQHIENKCRQLKQHGQKQRQNWAKLFVNDRRQFLYCPIAKTGTASWRYTLAKFTGKHLPIIGSDYRNPKVQNFVLEAGKTILKRGNLYNTTQKSIIINTYYKFMFVREPLERLVSAYRWRLPNPNRLVNRIKYEIRKRRQIANKTHKGKIAQLVI